MELIKTGAIYDVHVGNDPHNRYVGSVTTLNLPDGTVYKYQMLYSNGGRATYWTRQDFDAATREYAINYLRVNVA